MYMKDHRPPIPALILARVELKKEPLKARFPNVYFGISHLDFYRFCQQYEDYFKNARVNGDNSNQFATSFLQDSINTR